MMYISSVFRNRMNSDDESLHYLSSDATINFIRKMNGLDSNMVLSAGDLSYDSPYNTYTHPGLPPGPICMPGSDAIQAALYPEPNSNYYYFCSDGNGGTVFAVTLAEHEENVARYQEIWESIDAGTYGTDESASGDGIPEEGDPIEG